MNDVDRFRSELAGLIERFCGADGDYDSGVPGLTLHRYSEVSGATFCIYEPCLSVAARGAKRATLANEEYVYDETQCVVSSVDLPVASQLVRASRSAPYLGVKYRLDSGRIANLLAEMDLSENGPMAAGPGITSARIPPALLDAVVRLTRLVETPDEIPIVAPLIEREIHFRLVSGRLGSHLRRVAIAGSRTSHVAKAIDWLKNHYAEPFRIGVLADVVNLSHSALHHHFKATTAMSPLQYQKQLRLQEARRLMLSERLDATSASRRVGYESASQFSREYRRLYGNPPSRDISALRTGTAAAGV